MTPWGTPMEEVSQDEHAYHLSDIQVGGEMIVLTLSGPDTYYDYHGRGAGSQYLACEKFASMIGVKVRVELCRDSAEVLSRLIEGDGDLAMLQLKKKSSLCDSIGSKILFCGMHVSDGSQWAVAAHNVELADTLNSWYSDDVLVEVRKEEKKQVAMSSVRRQVYSPMLDSSKGIISKYDDHFKKYAATAGIDWRLLAAQCYQESAFDAKAVSWAGACGLMQIMPSTAQHLGMSSGDVWNAEKNIAASTRYMRELSGQFRDIPAASERHMFVLAAYNGGYNHIRDAMSLTTKNGGNSKSWREVKKYVLLLTQQAYYNDPVVKYGYMRGNETVDYVDSIINRWRSYKNKVQGSSIGGTDSSVPRPAKRAHRFDV